MSQIPFDIIFSNGEFTIKDREGKKTFITRDMSVALTLLIHEYKLDEGLAREIIDETVHNKKAYNNGDQISLL